MPSSSSTSSSWSSSSRLNLIEPDERLKASENRELDAKSTPLRLALRERSMSLSASEPSASTSNLRGRYDIDRSSSPRPRPLRPLGDALIARGPAGLGGRCNGGLAWTSASQCLTPTGSSSSSSSSSSPSYSPSSSVKSIGVHVVTGSCSAHLLLFCPIGNETPTGL